MRNFMIILMLPFLLAACGEPSFNVDGMISDGAGKSVVLEKADFSGRWIAIDSAHTSSDGSFYFKTPAPDAPEIFRLALDGKYIYFPVDSTETIKVSAAASAFDTEFNIDGSENARMLEKFEKRIIAFPVSATDAETKNFKRSIYTDFIQPLGASVVSYYILTKTHDGKPLFDPGNDDDTPYYAAVATAFRQFSPQDPRTRLLENVSLENLRRRNANAGRQRVVNAEEIKFFDISLPDPTGSERRLSETVGKGKTVVLVFSLMNHPESPAVNKQLHDIYASGRADIYQVSLDADRYSWREAAANLPWTSVFDANGISGAVTDYNVRNLPVFFIIDRTGSLADRADDFRQLESKLSKF